MSGHGFWLAVLVCSLFVGCDVMSKDTSANTWIMETDELPMENTTGKDLIDFRKMAAVGNGHVATVLYSDVIYMNGLYNGPVGWTHRAAIQSVHDIVVSMPGRDVTRHYSLDTYRAVFTETIRTSGLEVKVMTYAHQRLVQLLVTEVHVTRTDGGSDLVTLTLNRSKMNDTADLVITEPLEEHIAGCDDDECLQTYGHTLITETETAPLGEVHVYWTDPPPSLTLQSRDQEMTWIFFSSIDQQSHKALAAFKMALDIRATTPHALRETHETAWRDKWRHGSIDVEGDDDLARVTHASLYYILMSLPSTTPELPLEQFYGLSPGSLARGANWTDYQGHVFWDMETWMYPPILVLFPSLARDMLSYRVYGGEGARAKAREHGYEGWQYPWESAFTGYEMTPLVCVPCREYEQHITGDVAFAARQYWASTRDVTWMTQEGGLDLIVNTADFWTSRAEYNEQQDRYEINGVMPPDEFAEHVNNSVYTNYGAKVNIQLADYASCLAGVVTSPMTSERRRDVADKLYIAFNETTQHHPEYEGYDHVETAWKNSQLVKQADVVMLGYPLGMEMDNQIRRNDLLLYEDRGDVNGPAMTWSMFAINWLELGEVEKAGDLFRRSYSYYRRPPFNTWTEVKSGVGATNFITGVGGFLQALIFGYGGLRIELEHVKFHPRLPPTTTRLTFTGIDYLGATFDLMVTSQHVLVVVRETDDAFPLQLTTEIGTTWRLNAGMELKLKQEPFTISSLSVPECPLPEGSSCPDVVHTHMATVTSPSLPNHVTRVVVSQSGGERCMDFITCSAAVTSHMADDDSINFYIGDDNRLYQGTAITKQPGVLRVMLLGDYTLEGMSAEQGALLRKLVKCGMEQQPPSISLDYKLQWEAEAPEDCGRAPCAGNSLHCQLTTWKHWSPDKSGVPPDCSAQDPTPRSTTPRPSRPAPPLTTPLGSVTQCPPVRPAEVTCNCQGQPANFAHRVTSLGHVGKLIAAIFFLVVVLS